MFKRNKTMYNLQCDHIFISKKDLSFVETNIFLCVTQISFYSGKNNFVTTIRIELTLFWNQNIH